MSDQALFLLVEDDENDILLVRRAFLKAKILNPLYVIKGGEAAIAYMNGDGPYSNRAEYPLPALVLLDLNMPGMDGFEVLRWMRQQEQFRRMRVVVLTSSNDLRDVNLAYQIGANSFLVKPVDFERFVEISQALAGYWLWTDKAPESFRLPLSAPLLSPAKTQGKTPAASNTMGSKGQ
jgi:CheY-like chemotaxis protein